MAVSVRDHFVKPIRRLFLKTNVATQQRRSDLVRIIQIVQSRIGRKVKDDGSEQRQPGWDPKSPDTVTRFVSGHGFSLSLFDERRPRSFSQAALVSGGTFWSALTSQETVASEFTTTEIAISAIIT